jgi:trehalose 6-phosphate phosphatase
VARILDNLVTLKKIIRRKPFGLITDMDGTISPIPRDFLETPVPPPVLPRLAKLATQLDLVAVISGRKSAAIKEIINIPGIECIGHYGMEWWENNHAVLHPDAEASLSAMRAVAAELEILRSVDGIIIQDKWATISVQYNTVQRPAVAKQQILDLLEKSPHIKNLRLIYEKTSIGILPRINIDKGTAVTRLIRQHCLMGAIYLGDDIGDLPAFRAIRQAKQDKNFDGLSILVTGSETGQSLINEVDFTLDGVQETETLLNWLVDNTMAQG